MKVTLVATLGLCLLAACARTGDAPAARSAGGALRVGLLPDRAEEELQRRFEPLVAYLEEATGLGLELWIPPDYEALLDAFDRGQVQLAWFGGLTFVQAARKSGAVPLVVRDIDLEFTSDYIASAASTGSAPSDFAGKRLAFGPRLSTSGHLMPRWFLNRAGIEPEEHFVEVRYSSGHDQTVRWVQSGEVDLAAVNSKVVGAMRCAGLLDPAETRVLSSTPPYANYVWAVRPELDAATRARLLDAFLALDPAEPRHAALLGGVDANGFLPAMREEYRELELAAARLGLLDEAGAP